MNCDDSSDVNVTIYLENYNHGNYLHFDYDRYEKDASLCELPNGAKCYANHNDIYSDARFHVACKRRNKLLGKYMPRYCKEQLIIEFNHEPQVYDCNSESLSERDVTADYKLNSDVPIPYICTYLDELIEVAKKPAPTTKTKGVALFFSKCSKSKERFNFIKQLMKYIQVDSYGDCFHNVDLPVSRREEDWQGIKQNISKQYRFLISSEGAKIPHFVTEKLWHAYLVQAIPIYQGTTDVFYQIPGNNTFLFTDDFSSVKALADHIKQIESDQKLYESFFKYDLTNFYKMKEKYCARSRICAICDGAYRSKLAWKRSHCKPS